MTSFIEIQTDCGTFSLLDLFDSEGILRGSPSLSIRLREETDLWDNDEYVINLLKSLHFGIDSLEVRELKEWSIEKNLTYETVEKHLVELYEEGVKLNMISL